MKLKSFATLGFKSFADKTELSFDQGITAIVGPNGSGKSNISDAIRWVLGEQSAKYLRGGKMEDVIFSGTAKRRSLGLAEVTVVFDNQDHQLPLDFAEVSLTRRLYRSGDSDYLINNKTVRLKDIIDLMADTGLGKGSMSIIGQNRIDEILNARPEERRTIFEEAAGIAKFRMRKKEAVRKLEETTQNLIRINDIKTEIENQVQPLAIEAEKTRKFNDLTARQRQVRLTKFMRQIDGVEEVRQKLLAKQRVLEEDLAGKQAELSLKEAEAQTRQLSLDQAMEEFAALNALIADKQMALERLKGDIKVLGEKESQVLKEGARLEESSKTLREQLLLNGKMTEQLVAEYDGASAQVMALSRKLGESQSRREEIEERLQQALKEQSDAQNAYFQGMQELLTLQGELETLEKDQTQKMQQRQSLKELIGKLEAAAGETKERGQQTADVLARTELGKESFVRELAAIKAELQEQQHLVQRIRGEKNEAERQMTAGETRLESLRRMQENYEGFNNGIRLLLKSGASWRQQIMGVAAELVQVPGHLVTAIETALGEGAQNLVCQTAQGAKEAIAYLKEQKAGRATFLPLDTVSPRLLQPEERALGKFPGVLGFAFDLVQCDKQSERALWFLLGRVLIAENMDGALAVAKAGKYRFRVVTLEGDVVNAGGSLTGGARRQREGYLSRQKQMEDLQKAVGAFKTSLLQAQERLEEAEGRVFHTGMEAEGKQAKINEADLKIKALQLEAADYLRRQKELDQQLVVALAERNAAANAYMTQRDRVQEVRSLLAEKKLSDQGAGALLETLQNRINKENSNLKILDGEVLEQRSQKSSAENTMQYLERRLGDLDKAKGEMESNLAKNEEETGVLEQEKAECRKNRQELEAEFEDQMRQLGSTSSRREEFETNKRELKERHDLAVAAAVQVRDLVTAADLKVHQAQMELVKQNAEYEHALEQLQMEYQLSVEQVRREDLLEDNDRELAKKDRQITMAIVDLGPVDPGAVEKYQEVKSRAELYQKQFQDMVEAKDKLEGVIVEINSGMGRRFKEAFAKINQYFAQCYKDLFGGGTALLKLSAGEDLLESGIEIEAQPPGKKLQGLFLLSGGERALTVIALLFALLSYKPSPFCILDEIDAPLDDANIGRFSAFLHSYAQKTQFIVITHRKGTMERADVLYGVTMQESGVSKLLSVKINETEDYA